MKLARYTGGCTDEYTYGHLYDVNYLGGNTVAVFNEKSDKDVWVKQDFHKVFTIIDKGDGEPKPKVRTFDSGASRDTDDNKLDFEAFLSPTVLKSYAEYMHKNRKLADGTLRDGDNWQKGIPKDAYMKSMWRHFFDVWQNHRGISTHDDDITNLNALLFNVMGMLHEKLKENGN